MSSARITRMTFRIATCLPQRARRIAQRIATRLKRPGAELRLPVERFGGAHYGSWTICPAGLGPASVVYSLGVGEDITFDLDLIARIGCNVHAFDPTPRTADWIAVQSLPPHFIYHRLGVADHNGVASFHPPVDSTHISHSMLPLRSTRNTTAVEVEVASLPAIMRQLGHARIDLLKMDIEGAEYSVLRQIASQRIPIGQIVVEFHDKLLPDGRDSRAASLATLRTAGFKVFHSSPNGEQVGLAEAKMANAQPPHN